MVLTGDSMVNGISEKGLSVNHKLKIVNFSGGTNEKILGKLDDIIKGKLDDLIVHVRTNDITNNVNLFDQRLKIFNKISKEYHGSLSHFHPSLTAKARRTTRKF